MKQESKMSTPHERLSRMRKSFAKNKSVLTEDYKYFITPDKPVKQPWETVRWKITQMSVNPISMV
jgi:ADP-dependent phosphofructokinase/glucokinase